MHVCAVIYWTPAGTQFSLSIGADSLFAVAMDQISSSLNTCPILYTPNGRKSRAGINNKKKRYPQIPRYLGTALAQEDVISCEQNGGENMERHLVKSSVIYNYRFPSDNKIKWEL